MTFEHMHLPLYLQRLPRYSLWLSLRQFYHDCYIYGTIDFIFDDASTVFHNCDIFVRRSMDHQANIITMQGRDHSESNTRISIIGSRIRPTPNFTPVKGWTEWKGSFALSTLYYFEYLNEEAGASTANRVKWNDFHMLSNAEEASPYTVSGFIHGDNWIPETGVPFSLGI
ncbi:hypothetical protein ACOSP7_024359 [Xanthoceras sorbifolium]